jgi:phosphonate transport system substrate-binding protein
MFATGPVHLDEDGEELRERFGVRLTEALSREVRVKATESYAEVRTMVASGEAHLAWLPPAIFVRVERDASVHLLAAVERSQGKGYRGVLFVKASSPMKAPGDLEGKRVAWVDPESCAGHLFPRLALAKRDLDPTALFANEQFCGSHGSVVHAVLQGRADVGATFAQTAGDSETITIAGWYPWTGAASMRAILVSDVIPPDVICAAPRAFTADELDAVKKALLALDEGGGTELLDELFGGPRLAPAQTSEYDAVRIATEF